MTWFDKRFEPSSAKVKSECLVCKRPMWFPASKAGKYVTCGGDCTITLRRQARAARKRECITCGTEFSPRASQLSKGGGRFCSQRCNVSAHLAMNAPEARAKNQAAFKEAIASGRYVPKCGEHAPRWKGGRASLIRAKIESGELAKRVQDYRRRNPDKVREFSRRRAGRKLGRDRKSVV